MGKNYPEIYKTVTKMMGELGQDIPDVMGAFQQLHHAGSDEGALSSKVKELIALSIAITVRCNGCIAFHVHDALKAGASREEITEAIGVAIVMGGGPSVVYGTEALEALKQFTA
ncbi:MAG: carboxymuconolactone decarboxylase family protein [Anaerolineae bacterium]|nr:carboxymuconolactone decarboxylase family protein [Anaerolineae bacterium]